MHNEKFMLSDLPDYYIGEEGDLKHYKEVSEVVVMCLVVVYYFLVNFVKYSLGYENLCLFKPYFT